MKVISSSTLTLGFELLEAFDAHPGCLVVHPLERSHAAGASATDHVAASAAVVAPGQEREFSVAPLAHGHAPVGDPDRRLLPKSFRVGPRGRILRP